MEGVYHLQPSFNEFRVFFNEKALEIRPNLVIRDYEWFPKRKQDFFLVRYGGNNALYGGISRQTGALQELALIREKDGSSNARLEMVVSSILILEALQLRLSMPEKSRLFEQLGLVGKRDGKEKRERVAHLGNITLRHYSTEGPGFYAFFLQYR
ncbi:MAG: hypothetical protein IMW85_08155 [Thermicanus sp.]|nr:hypothetical protein [Thermicanus sp.]